MNNVSAVFTQLGVESEIGQMVVAVDPYPLEIFLGGKARNNFNLLKVSCI